MSDLEYCCKCGEPTGHAGAGEDSIFCANEDCQLGPLCRSCAVLADDCWCTKCAADEIERLRKEHADYLEECHEIHHEHNKTNAEQAKRIEELEQEKRECEQMSEDIGAHPHGSVHIITDDQIRAAWGMSEDGYIGEDVLRELGIERCHCKTDSPPKHGYFEQCPDCNGEGWVKK
jgi:hypothetical protein